MKIARVVFSYNKQVGISRGVVEVVERLAKEHEVHVFANSWTDVRDRRIIFHKVPVLSNRASLRTVSFFVFSGILLRRHDFDIVHLHHSSAYPCDVITCHGLASAGIHTVQALRKKYQVGVKPRAIRHHSLMLPISEYNYRNASRKRIIAISQSIKRDLVRFCGVPSQDIIVIHNGVNLDEFHPAHKKICRGPTRKRFKLKEDDFVFLFVGHFFRRKGLNVVLNALSRIPTKNVKLLVVGRDSVEQDVFIRLAQDMGIKSRIVFAGSTPDVNHFYAASDALVFPTLYEPFGLVILEAMASGLPVITSRTAGAAQVIVDDVNGLLLDDPTNERELLQQMELLIQDNELRMRLGSGARNTALEHSWDVVAERTLNLYRELYGNN